MMKTLMANKETILLAKRAMTSLFIHSHGEKSKDEIHQMK